MHGNVSIDLHCSGYFLKKLTEIVRQTPSKGEKSSVNALKKQFGELIRKRSGNQLECSVSWFTI